MATSDDDANVFETAPAADQRQAAERVLTKLRTLSQDMDDVERATLATLLAPGLARAYEDQDVQGFGLVDWLPEGLPDALAQVVRDEGLGDGLAQ